MEPTLGRSVLPLNGSISLNIKVQVTGRGYKGIPDYWRTLRRTTAYPYSQLTLVGRFVSQNGKQRWVEEAMWRLGPLLSVADSRQVRRNIAVVDARLGASVRAKVLE